MFSSHPIPEQDSERGLPLNAARDLVSAKECKKSSLLKTAFTSLLSLVCVSSIFAQAQPNPPAADLRSEVLMGMRLESIERVGAETRVLTTGSEFVLGKGGRIRCFQRIPERREVAAIRLPSGAPLILEKQNDFACRFTAPGFSVTLQGDSLMIVHADQDLKTDIEGLFRPTFQSETKGNWLFIDGIGGFGLYPSKTKTPETRDLVHQGVKDRRGGTWFVNKAPAKESDANKVWSLSYGLSASEELWISVFPPRPYSRKHADEIRMAHEGSIDPYAHPSTALIESSAKFCNLMVVHSALWSGGERPPWKIPAFVPRDRKEYDRVREDLHRTGMKMVPYLSPYYYAGSDFFTELQRAVDDYRVDGAYFDGVSMDFRKSYEFIRRSRQILGDDRILFTHCTTDPLKSGVVYCPFIDTYSDYIYRGEAGRSGMELDDFLRWTISGYNISNSVGYWIYTGSTAQPAAPTKENPGSYMRQTPEREDIDAALRNEVRLPRTEIGYQPEILWKPGDGHLEFFDRYYYGELDRKRTEHATPGRK